MPKKSAKPKPEKLPPYHWGANIPMSLVRRFVRQVAEKFRPDKIILFGSYAYGTPNENSDIDLLVIMPARNQLDQAWKICRTIEAPFSMDLIVRTPKEMKWRLKERESFTTEIVTKGKVLYEKGDRRVGGQSRRGLSRRKRSQSKKARAA
jgi:predicted nucleotidyltransferase